MYHFSNSYYLFHLNWLDIGTIYSYFVSKHVFDMFIPRFDLGTNIDNMLWLTHSQKKKKINLKLF